jgi:serine/threonine protein kinase/Tol biopolymer transport system component
MATTNNDDREHEVEQAVWQFLDAQLRGSDRDIEEIVKKYPEFEDRIRQKITEFQKVDSLFDSLVRVDESDFAEISDEYDLVGKNIGNFKIEEVIGRGGMGVVYLAHDTRLDRSVAVKSIPAELQASSTAQARFQREAKLLASLNHPNIAVIHEIIEEKKSGYLILEYIPGETLAERIAREPLNLEEALSIGQQIAEAVSAAHEKGVIHRDLKPGNIKITPDGIVKVLDFGLAKTFVSEGRSSEITVTQPGRVMGTPAYMSPEQARGKPTDKRSDIWSFGCIMYQMLTGELPFDGETATDTLARIIERQPDWEALPQETPMNIRTLLRRCLEKNPQKRLRDIGDAFIEIQETLNLPADVPPQTTSLQADRQPLSWPRLIAIMAVGIIIGGILIVLGIWGLWPSYSVPRAAVKSFSITPKTELAIEALAHNALAFSPDGKLLAYIEQGTDWRMRIYLRSMEKFEAKPLSGTEGAISPFFSPDGQWIAYVDHYQRTLKKVSIKGGEPISLAECGQFRGGSWGTDDRIVFTPLSVGGLWRISASGEALEELTHPDPNLGERGHCWPQTLPDGEHVLFTCRRSGKSNQIEIYSLKTGKRRVLFNGGTYARYLPTGHIMYGREETLYAVAFDLAKYHVSGSHVPVVSDAITSHLGSAQFTFAQDGSLAYIPAVAQHTELEPVWVTKDDTTSLAITKRNYHSVSVSPDGAYAAFRVPLHGESNGELWIYDSDRRTANRIAKSIGISTAVWTPDSNEVIYYRYDGSDKLFRQKIDGTEEPKLVAQFECYTTPTSCSPDGMLLLADRNDPNRPMFDADIWVVPLDGGPTAKARPFIERYNNQKHGVWSPDGRWIAYGSDESGAREIYVEPYPGPGPKTKISINGGLQPVWSQDGKELFYRSSGKKMVAATIETEPQLRVTGRKELFEWKYLSCIICQTYDVAPDGRFLMIRDPKESPIQRINVVLNWFDELKRLVPSGKE